jgi:hypothetical protein
MLHVTFSDKSQDEFEAHIEPTFNVNDVVAVKFDCVTVPPYFAGCENLKEISFTDKVHVISRAAFSGCVNLSSHLEFPKNVRKVFEFAFFNCKNIQGNLILPLECEHIGVSAFCGCENLDGLLFYPKDSLAYFANDYKKEQGFHFKDTKLTQLRLADDWTMEEELGNVIGAFVRLIVKGQQSKRLES